VASSGPIKPALRAAEDVGRWTARGLDSLGFGASLVYQSLYWLLLGRRRGQIVRAEPVFAEMMEIGIRALPIVTMLSATIGVMLALQGIYSLKTFGAESQVTLGVALGVTREFAPLITGILVAGRSGSALAARLGTMIISNEVDALRVMGVNPVRYLVVPGLLAMLVMLPALALWSDFVALFAAGLYITADLGMNLGAYVQETLRAISIDDLTHGLKKSLLFAVLITIVAVVDGSSVEGGAEGVGRVTTQSVVHSIMAIVLTDMLFVFAATR
jgi:phospholipid/cholesterol/gamma-HCH transport system permease protein